MGVREDQLTPPHGDGVYGEEAVEGKVRLSG